MVEFFSRFITDQVARFPRIILEIVWLPVAHAASFFPADVLFNCLGYQGGLDLLQRVLRLTSFFVHREVKAH